MWWLIASSAQRRRSPLELVVHPKLLLFLFELAAALQISHIIGCQNPDVPSCRLTLLTLVSILAL